MNGIQLKGPAEANGFNVDTSHIPLPCGGHVTPPVGPGPLYHYHKAADCEPIQVNTQILIESNIRLSFDLSIDMLNITFEF